MRVLVFACLAACAAAPRSSIEALDAATIARLREVGALKDGCPVPASDLVRVRFVHHLAGGGDGHGQLVVHRRVAGEVATILAVPDGTPAPVEFSIHSYGTAIDINPRTNPYFKPRDMATWRAYAGDHAGTPLPDVLNRFCLEQPDRCTVLPPTGAAFVDRTQTAPGILRAGDATVDAFTSRGWRWGGTWPANDQDKVRTDTQHFEKDLEAPNVSAPKKETPQSP